jgi:hypothetical protein
MNVVPDLNSGEEGGEYRPNMESWIAKRSDLLLQAGVPKEHVPKILAGYYTVWDDETVYWEGKYPGNGGLAMRILRPAYELDVHLTGSPDPIHGVLINRAIPAPCIPLRKGHTVSYLTPAELNGTRSVEWLDEVLLKKSALPDMEEAFPWGPVEVEMKSSGRFGFQQGLAELVRDEPRFRLWRSFECTLRVLWAHLTGILANKSLADPWAMLNLWTLGNALPVGFSKDFSRDFVMLVGKKI